MSFDRKAYQREYYHKNKEAFKEYREKNKESRNEYNREYQKEYRKNHKDKENARILAWYHKNFDKIKEKKYARDKEWRSRNKGIINFHTNKRYTVRKQRLPIWLTEENKLQIKAMYVLASSLTKSTEYEWQVDHIIPLQGKNVSGLHVPENLQVIERSINSKKRNKYEPE
jgi:predicted patatin/cPLA2 family phospholipase